MDKKDVIAQLNENRKKVLIKNPPHQLEILATLRVAKKGSETTKERVAVMRKRGDYFFKSYTGALPNTTVDSFRLSKHEADIVLSVIEDFNTYQHYHTNSYSWLVCGCFYKGFDLIKEGLLEV